MSKLIKETEKWVRSIYFNADHLIRAVFWVKKLDPKSDEAVLIAALTHDIERTFPQRRRPPGGELRNWDDREYNLWHGKRSAGLVAKFLREKGATKELIKKVAGLIITHEIGGTYEADLVKDADSISFLETNAPWFIAKVPEQMSKESIGEKFDYMFKRISFPKAKKLAQPFYEQALTELAKK